VTITDGILRSIASACLLLAVGRAVAAEAPPPRKTSPAGTATVVFVGDVMLDNGPGHVIASGTDPFAACADLLLDADFTIGNLECVLGRGGKLAHKAYVFRGAADSPRHLKRYFTAVSLGNNHAFDFGPEGLVECLDILDRERIGRFGAGRTLAEARKPFVVEKDGLRIAILAANGFRADDYAATDARAGVAPLREADLLADIAAARTTADVVIPYVHWGDELVAEPLEADRAFARKMIEAGAAAVIGGHPHVTQTVDLHRGAPIVYSLGNFVFDYYPVDPPEWTGWVVKLTVAKGEAVALETRAVVLDPAGLPKPVVDDEP
jgi:poly-gamma-glutamate capsule biosynthesis protein CapA/YwtB (metallophosphatase superfamily)